MTDKLISYGDDFDRSTVQFFRGLEKRRDEEAAEIPLDDPKRDARIGMLKCVYDVMIYFRKCERAKGREKHIRDCIEKNRKQEELLASAQPRTDIPCLRCQTRMVFNLKTPESSSIGGDRDRVLLIYSCPNKCIPGRAFYDNGEEWHSKKSHCEKCQSVVETEDYRKDDKITFTDTCLQCGHVKKHVMDLSARKEKTIVDENYAADRARFCVTDDELFEYTRFEHGLKVIKEMTVEDDRKKEASKLDEVVATVRMIRVMELQTLIAETLEKESFVKVSLSDPTSDGHLFIKVTAFDNDATRTDEVSKKSAKAAIEAALEETNWRLVKGSLNVTLGALAGVINGYTSETEVRNLIKAEKSSNVSRNNDKDSI